MNKVYPREVSTVGDNIIALLMDDGFFGGEYFSATTYCTKYVKDVLLDKFLHNQPLDLGDEEEMGRHLDLMISGSIIYQLIEQGYVDSYEDEHTPEVFFTTEKGRHLLREFKEDKEK